MATNYRDKRFKKVQGGPLTLTNVGSTSINQWFGTTLITSRHEFVAAPVVAATSRIRLDGPNYLTHANSSLLAISFGTSSIQAGSGFYITANSIAFGGTTPYSIACAWEIVNPR